MRTIAFLFLIFALFVAFGCGGGSSDDDDAIPGDDDDINDDDDLIDDDDDTVSGDTWTDPVSGLTWQVTPSDDGFAWEQAKFYCESLSLNEGGWRLPSISELRTLIRDCADTETGGACGVTDSCLDLGCSNEDCNGCGPFGGCHWPSQLNGDCLWYWSSCGLTDNDDLAWGVYFNNGGVVSIYIDEAWNVRCVR